MEPHKSGSGGRPSDLKWMNSRAESPELSCVSMKSSNSIRQPPFFSDGGQSPELSCVSMKSSNSIRQPPFFSNGGQSPELSCVSMKSSNSIRQPPFFSDGGSGIDTRGRRDLLQDTSRCGVCEQLLTDPVSITCGHRFCRLCISSYWTRTALSGDFVCPCCRKRSKTRPALHPHVEESMKQDSHQPVDDVLQRVSQRHRASMKNRYESLFEGIKAEETRTLLNRIYTQLYIIEGETEGVNEEHEVLQMEKTPSKYSEDTPINCSDIFKPAEDPKGAVMVDGLRQNQKKRSKGPEEIRTVLTKGIAGIGKTVSVQKFILDWAEGEANQDVDFMFVLPFRELNLIKDHQYSLHGLLCAFHPELRELDCKIYDQCKVVFIFDGLDESRIPLNFSECEKVSDITMTSSVGVLMTNLIKGELLPSAHVWITSRPAAANQIPPQYISRVTEIQGFNDPQKEEYFRKRIRDQDQAQNIISHIKTARSLHIMCHIPVFCWISATVLQRIMRQSNTEIPKTLTEMYSHFLITQTNMKKEKYEENSDRDPVELLRSNRTLLLKLAELAFKQLIKGNVMFYEEDLRESGIDVTEASVYSGICTEIFREECVLYQRKVYSFVHLSFQEFLAAFYVFHCYLSKNMKVLSVFNPRTRRWPESFPLHELLRGAVHKALESQNGHLDLFLRFLLGISLESSQKVLQGLLIHTESSSESISETVQYIKELMEEEEDLPTDRSVNLFLCLTEMKDQHLSRKIQEFLNSEKRSEKKLSAAECVALSYMLQTSEEVLDELDLKKYSTSRAAYMKLLPAVNKCRKALLSDCYLTMKDCETVCSALQSENSSLKELDLSNSDLQDSGVELLSAGLKSSHCNLQILRLALCKLGVKTCETLGSVLKLENSSLKELDLSNNDLQDSGVELLSAGLKSSHCKLQILRLSGCMITEEGCSSLAAALRSNPSHLKELDLTYNHPGESGEKLLSARLKDPHCTLETLRLSGCMVTEEGCSSLAAALRSNPSHLKELDLTYNHPGESGEKLLSARLEDPHCTLETLRVEYGENIRMKPGLKKYACDLTLDPNTAFPRFILSEGNRKAVNGETYLPYPDNPERFDCYGQVMSRERLTGHCYWEVEWGSEIEVGVIYESIGRKGGSYDCRFGLNKKSWTLFCSDRGYTVRHNNNSTDLPTPSSGCKRVGVYVDCPAGTVSFYRVSSDTHTLTHLHTFSTTFTEPLYAGILLYDLASAYLCEME
ncbi:LOW QUALITY PROTEIN: uncharacterized protein [Salminus brasiliensis]|uniref:LOW QUALITY PROTEIN: uncharacterized protein n=1 Tax=Salminus brasiliensis TaxID=930266 RepID=UPI003B832E62